MDGTFRAETLALTQERKLAINDDRMARALDQLAEYGGRGVFFELARRSIELFGLKTDRVHFDTTSVTFSGEYKGSGAAQEAKITRGRNNDGRPNLKQLVFGLNVTSDGAMPLSHGVFSGNRNDDTLHRDNVDGLRDLLDKDDFIYVADCKLCTKENLAHIDSFGGKFVTILPRSRKEDAAFREQLRKTEARWRSILKVERDDRGYRVDTYATTKKPEKTDKVLPIYPEARRCKAPTTPRILDFFSQVEWFRHVAKDEEAVFPVRLSDLQAQILRLLGVPRKGYEGYPFDAES